MSEFRAKGTNLVGGSAVGFDRVKDDFYATDPNSVKDLLNHLEIKGDSFYEPCVGQGHIAEVIKEAFPNAEHFGSDLVDRGYPATDVLNFLEDPIEINADWVISNPPYKDAKAFIQNSLECTNKGVAMFLKIQFLEGQSRKEWLKDSPLKYVYVFSKRQDAWRDGLSVNPETSKKWGGTMCFAWFVWEHGYDGEAIIRWI